MQGIEEFGGEILLIGFNYDEKSKKHSCKIEKYSGGACLARTEAYFITHRKRGHDRK